MEVWTVKVIILVSLFLATYLFSLLPIWLMRVASRARDASLRRKFDRAISFLSCFAAGVFLATCLLDIYPDVEDLLRKTIQGSLDAKSKFQEYPFSESVMVVGFFLVLIVEQLVLAVKERNQPVEMTQKTDGTVSQSNSATSSKHRNSYGATNGGQSAAECDPLLDESRQVSALRARSGSIGSIKSITGISNRPSRTHSVVSANPEDYDVSMHQDPNSHSPIRAFIMLAALSLHSVFEGLAVGLQATVEGVVSVFGALILHKCIIAFSIGLNLVQSRLSVKKIISSNAIFCIASPLGIAIGIIILRYENASSGQLTSGILQGLACGTFLYVTFFEVLPHEFNKPADRELKLLFVIFGFIFVNGVLFLELFLKKGDD